ncbi:hypothetical protein FRB94_002186 [Tulasnella sp. JGI-2019a]|nr:hypothetical protein FRB93_003943 [Tulasnella sp. JGI-2019a]KAG9004646.1 hypothetical protein FRB94_002186 [Tulasnella sp. JGI-2019a]KAG9029517.1 hypothetical protein FRB95_005238 [Tulasnella sp. JGI-2019a]
MARICETIVYIGIHTSSTLPTCHSTMSTNHVEQQLTDQVITAEKTTLPYETDDGDISKFAKSAGAKVVNLTPQYAELKQSIVGSSPEAHQHLRESFANLLEAIKAGVEEIKSRGSDVVPEASFTEVTSKGSDGAWIEEVKRRGVVVVRDVVDDEEALEWKEKLKRYVEANPQVTAYANKQVFEMHWSKSQLAARSHPNLLEVQKSLMGKLFHAGPNAPISFNVPISYSDRFRIRLPGDSRFALGPHIDGGSVERWEDEAFRGCYREILEGQWRDHDAWDAERRLEINSNLHGGGGCGVFRAFQAWLSMSSTGPKEGTLRVFPLLKESSSYVLLRPFFRPTVPPTSPEFLSASSWELDLTNKSFPGSFIGLVQELSQATHPHLQLEEGGMVSVKKVRPGDMVFWHPDTIHAVEQMHQGEGDSSVMYIPAVPLTTKNAEYLLRQRGALISGHSAPDFGGGSGERGAQGDGRPEDITTDEGRRAMGLQPYAEWPGMTDGEKEVVRVSNEILGW